MQITRLSLKHIQILRKCKRFLTSNLLLINTGTCCALYTVGDLIEQRIEGHKSEKKLDWARTARMAILGFCMGPVNHYWYVGLDRALPGIAAKTVGKKVLADQLLMAPFCYTIFYMGKTVFLQLQLQYWEQLNWNVYSVAACVGNSPKAITVLSCCLKLLSYICNTVTCTVCIIIA